MESPSTSSKVLQGLRPPRTFLVTRNVPVESDSRSLGEGVLLRHPRQSAARVETVDTYSPTWPRTTKGRVPQPGEPIRTPGFRFDPTPVSGPLLDDRRKVISVMSQWCPNILNVYAKGLRGLFFLRPSIFSFHVDSCFLYGFYSDVVAEQWRRHNDDGLLSPKIKEISQHLYFCFFLCCTFRILQMKDRKMCPSSGRGMGCHTFFPYLVSLVHPKESKRYVRVAYRW